MNGNQRWYNLKPLQKKEGDNPYKLATTQGDHDEIIFNFCETFVPDDTTYHNCPNDGGFGYLYDLDQSKCHPLSSKSDEVKFEETFEDDTLKGVKLTFPSNGGDCPNQMEIQLTCNKDRKVGQPDNYNVQLDPSNTCIELISMDAYEACPSFDMNGVISFMMDHKYAWGAVFVLIGVIVNFFGRKAIKPTIFLITTILVSFFLMLLIYSIFSDDSRENWVDWTVLGVSLLIGAVLGFILTKFIGIGIGVLGGFGGVSLGLLITSTFQFQEEYMFWIIVIGCAAVFGLASLKFKDELMIFSTAILGSFLIVRGIGYYAGGYPDVFEVASLLKTGHFEFPNTYYYYFGGNILLLLAGMYFQVKGWKDESPSKKHPYHSL